MADQTNGDQIQAIQQLDRDMAIVRMENENIQALAKSEPRDYRKILDDLKQQLDVSNRFAKEAIYSKPVGKDPQTGEMRFARGLSIRTAEAMAAAYGYNRVSTTVSKVDEDTVRIDASFTDYQRGRIWQDSVIVSKWYKARGGKMTRHNDDRFLGTVVKAERSKLIREVINRSVPPGVRAEFEDLAEARAADLLTEGELKKLVVAFAGRGIDITMLQNRVVKPIEKFNSKDRLMLAGIWNALEEGETTVDQAFGDLGKEPSSDSGEPSVTMDDLTNPANVQNGDDATAKDAETQEAASSPTPAAEDSQPDKMLAAEFREVCDRLKWRTKKEVGDWLESLEVFEGQRQFSKLNRAAKAEAIKMAKAIADDIDSKKAGGKTEQETFA